MKEGLRGGGGHPKGGLEEGSEGQGEEGTRRRRREAEDGGPRG